MALFEKLKKNILKKEDTQVPQVEAKKAKDTRPVAPPEVLEHEQKECIRVYGSIYYQDKLTVLPGDFVEVDISKNKHKDWDGYLVTDSDGDILGTLLSEQLERSGIEKGAHVTAEIHRPIYRMQDEIVLYIPKTEKALEEERIRDEMKLWVNLDGSKWLYEDAERYDFSDVDVLLKPAKGSGKPTYVIIGDGTKLFEVSSRMKMYPDLAKRNGYKPRRLIVEHREGDYGPYYHIGFYY